MEKKFHPHLNPLPQWRGSYSPLFLISYNEQSLLPWWEKARMRGRFYSSTII